MPFYNTMTGEDRRKLIVKSCWASPSNSTNDEIKFVLIDQPGCANHSMVQIIENGETTQARFTSDVFAFSGYNEVYLFCDISICFDKCTPVSDKNILINTGFGPKSSDLLKNFTLFKLKHSIDKIFLDLNRGTVSLQHEFFPDGKIKTIPIFMRF